ncbi:MULTISPECIES: penicillin-binding transpeptidase domain-containing protein [unclassified Streptomyces]|uniref:penicillin-binding transpeptidase domain-containing protein n=1 Tax=unclassified Streptomyces TaxID=2593676 RepID=UPI000DBA4B2E|nr:MULTISPECIES: penicillin-binding transpeptidase domain-containing protein [unclassified Streptomyces]MYT72675.1 penicillin-binding protein [Streptomyces sp. SID8367]RAJ79532.1 MecA-like transpeptidase family protein [Streptomyces sp. PsTaAH-137]
MRKGVKVAIVGGVFTVMVGGAGYGAYNIISAVTEDGGSSSLSGASAKRTGPPTGDEIKETSQKFLKAWAKNDPAEASHYTNNADGALASLEGWHDEAHITRTVLTAGKPAGAKVPFKVKATVAWDKKTRTLEYASSLTVVRGQTTGRPLVDWEPSVLHPDLQKGDKLVTGEAAAPPIEAVDRNGTVLTAEKYPSLSPVLDQLRAKYGDEAGGSPGVETSIERTAADGTTTTAKTLVTLTKGRPGKLRTTISASAQAAAEQAVTKYPKAAVVAVHPRTGEVLALANHGYGQFNTAFLGKRPPGSTMKIVTAAALLDNRILSSMNSNAPCDDSVLALGQTFHNLKNMAPDKNATLSSSFQRSCNTSFIKLSDELGGDKFAAEASQRFGLGENWQTGIQSYDGNVPVNGNSQDPAGMIGQGNVQMNPLNMASVTATAITGTFRQPILVSPKYGDRQLATAQGLPGPTVTQLRAMMHATATSPIGTATQAMAGVPGYIGAKTGSAESDGQAVSDSWFTGFRDGVATAAAMVENGGHGGTAAGPIVAAVLKNAG